MSEDDTFQFEKARDVINRSKSHGHWNEPSFNAKSCQRFDYSKIPFQSDRHGQINRSGTSDANHAENSWNDVDTGGGLVPVKQTV